MRIEEHLLRAAAAHPDKIAIVAGERRVTYAELLADARGLASGLHRRGVGRGDRVIIFSDNTYEAVAAIYATAFAGGVFSVVNHTTKAEKLAYILENCTPSAILTTERLAPEMAAAIDSSGVRAAAIVVGDTSAIRDASSYQQVISEGAEELPGPGIETDLAMLVYTSGSTGRPKGVMMTHHNVDFAAWSITTYLENTADDVILCALPISFDYGLYQILMSVRLGATLVLEKGFSFPQAVLNRIVEERVSGFPIVPTMAALLLQMRDLQPGQFPSLRYISNTAAALPKSHIVRLQDLFPGVAIFSMYGLTECKRCTWLPPSELAKRPGSVGRAIPGTEAYVVDKVGQKVPPGTQGELVIRGPHVMQGYWKAPKATAAALRPGPYPWERVLYTGDLFRADEEGYLYFQARKDDIIKTRGEKVSPKEVEDVLHGLAGVREAVVVGVDDPILGSAIDAYLTIEEGAELDRKTVLRHCAEHLEDFMRPKRVHFVDRLPTTSSGKVSRRALVEETKPD